MITFLKSPSVLCCFFFLPNVPWTQLENLKKHDLEVVCSFNLLS